VEHEFNERLARKIYGGCGLFLMPSHTEPCGWASHRHTLWRSAVGARDRRPGDTVIDAGRSSRHGRLRALHGGGVAEDV
jgi:hypothetical protein